MPIPAPVAQPDDSLSSNTPSGPGQVALIVEDQGTSIGDGYPEYPANMWRIQEISATGTQSVDTPLCVRADATSAAVTYTLLPSRLNSLKMLHVMKVDSSANNVIVALDASDTLYGASVSLTLATQYKSVTLLAINVGTLSGWHIIATT